MSRRPSRGFRIGQMTSRIDIESATESLSTGEPVRTWSKLIRDASAKVETVSGGETLRGRQIVQGVTKLFTIRRPDVGEEIDSKNRIVYGSEYYGIVLVTEPEFEGRARYLEIQAKVTDEQ